ncbi:MAG TPA: hypothetical protein ENI15_11385, partial [Spirochaetes bacterium]|nr:hypothetical protein [Spirochaetota bacterium]
FKDSAGNFYVGIADNTTWNFETTTSLDFTPPSVLSLSPADGLTGVPLSTNLVINFSEEVVADNGSIRIYDSLGTPIESIPADSAQVTGLGTSTITIDPSVDFAGLTNYYVQIDSDAFKDSAGNFYVGIADNTTWNFQTATIGPLFAAPVQNPFGLTNVLYLAAPTFADLDGDGDMDLLAGEYYGNFQYFENTGTAFAPAFAAPVENPFGLTNTYFYSFPAFADLDGDGDMDLLAGEYYGNFQYFENTGTAFAPAFAAPVQNDFGLTNVLYLAAPAFADLDGDGDMDLLAGEAYGNFQYFENTTP